MVSQDEILEFLLGRTSVTRKELESLLDVTPGGANMSRPLFQLEKHGFIGVERLRYRELRITLLDRRAALRRLGRL